MPTRPEGKLEPNQTVLITGGGRGLGRAIALALAQAGSQVAVTARSAAELAQTVELIQQSGGRALALPADVTDHTAITQVVAAAESQLGPIDLLINCAGSFRALGLAAVIDPDEWWREVEISFRGPFVCMRAVLPGMITRTRPNHQRRQRRGPTSDPYRLGILHQQDSSDPLDRGAGSRNPTVRHRHPGSQSRDHAHPDE